MPLPARSAAERPMSLRYDEFHAVAVQASANPLLPGLLEQVTPLLRRLERARFGSLAGRGSVADHDRIIELSAEGRADDAARAAHENWSTLGRLLHLDEADEADHAHAPATTPSPEGAPWPSPTSPATG
jgi:DNA-binding FadR family transcriptional regulator